MWKMRSEETLKLWTEWLNNLTLVREELGRPLKKKVKLGTRWDKFNNRLIGLLQILWASWLAQIRLGRASNLLPQIINRIAFEHQGSKGLANSSEELTATRTWPPEIHTLWGSCKPSLDRVEAFKLWNLLVQASTLIVVTQRQMASSRVSETSSMPSKPVLTLAVQMPQGVPKSRTLSSPATQTSDGVREQWWIIKEMWHAKLEIIEDSRIIHVYTGMCDQIELPKHASINKCLIWES